MLSKANTYHGRVVNVCLSFACAAFIEVVSRDILWFIGSIVIVVMLVIFVKLTTMWLAAF
jgi:hypothetical protein